MKIQTIYYALFLSLIPTQNAVSQEMVFAEIIEDGFTYYKMSSCPYRFGKAGIFYAGRYYVNDLTDVCFNEDSGKLWSSEPMNNLTLVSEDSNGARFEDLSSSGERTYITLTKPWQFDGPCKNQELQNYELQGLRIGQPTRASGSGSVFSQGSYLIDQSSEIRSSSHYGNGFISVQFPSVIDDQPAHSYGQNSFPGISFDDIEITFGPLGNGSISLTHKPAVGTRDAVGILSLLSGDGELHASGQLEVKNSRIAGYQPDEWKEANLKFVGFRGHTYGKDAEYLSLLGWVKGTFLDAENTSHTFRANAQISACQLG